jgi:transcriptional regulator with XRE-family HTH domain
MTLLMHWIQRQNDTDISAEEKQQLKSTFEELNRLRTELKTDEAALLAYIKAQISVHVPFQLRALRSAFEDGRQQTLASRADMKQPSISNLEKPGWNGVHTETLARLAAAMRVGLIVKFAPISEMIEWHESFSPDEVNIPNLDTEIGVALRQLVLAETPFPFPRDPGAMVSAESLATQGRGRERAIPSSIEDSNKPFYLEGVVQ